MFGFVVVVFGKNTQRMVIPVLWLGLLLLSVNIISKNTQRTHGHTGIMVGFVVVVIVSTHNAWSYRYYVWVCRCCLQQ